MEATCTRGTGCVNRARPDLRGRRRVTGGSTRTSSNEARMSNAETKHARTSSDLCTNEMKRRSKNNLPCWRLFRHSKFVIPSSLSISSLGIQGGADLHVEPLGLIEILFRLGLQWKRGQTEEYRDKHNKKLFHRNIPRNHRRPHAAGLGGPPGKDVARMSNFVFRVLKLKAQSPFDPRGHPGNADRFTVGPELRRGQL